MSIDITIESVGRRHYFRGNTYPIKDRLRNAGAKWDADAKAWWTGKRDVAEKLVASLGGSTTPAASPSSESSSSETKVAGKALYKGREYLLLWEGMTKRGHAAKLSFQDGSKVFWVDSSEVQVTKRYREPMSLAKLEKLRDEYKAQKQAEKDCALVGQEGAYSAQYEASRHNRLPAEKIGTASWLRHQGQRIAVVLVGYEPATYVRSEDAEDMGHHGVRSGWYGLAHYRAATAEEYEALQAKSFRADGVCVGIEIEPAPVANAKAHAKASAEQQAAREAMPSWLTRLVQRAEHLTSAPVPTDAWRFSLRSTISGSATLCLTEDALWYVVSTYDDGPYTYRRPITAADVALVCELMAVLTACTRHEDCRRHPELGAACVEAA